MAGAVTGGAELWSVCVNLCTLAFRVYKTMYSRLSCVRPRSSRAPPPRFQPRPPPRSHRVPSALPPRPRRAPAASPPRSCRAALPPPWHPGLHLSAAAGVWRARSTFKACWRRPSVAIRARTQRCRPRCGAEGPDVALEAQMQPQRPRCSPGASDAALEAQMQLWRFRCCPGGSGSRNIPQAKVFDDECL